MKDALQKERKCIFNVLSRSFDGSMSVNNLVWQDDNRSGRVGKLMEFK